MNQRLTVSFKQKMVRPFYGMQIVLNSDFKIITIQNTFA